MSNVALAFGSTETCPTFEKPRAPKDPEPIQSTVTLKAQSLASSPEADSVSVSSAGKAAESAASEPTPAPKEGWLSKTYRFFTGRPEKVTEFTHSDIDWINSKREQKYRLRAIGPYIYTGIFGLPRLAIEAVKGIAASLRLVPDTTSAALRIPARIVEPIIRHPINLIDRIYRGVEFIGTMPFPDEGMLLYKEDNWHIWSDGKGHSYDIRALAGGKLGVDYDTIIGAGFGLIPAYPKNIPVVADGTVTRSVQSAKKDRG